MIFSVKLATKVAAVSVVTFSGIGSDVDGRRELEHAGGAQRRAGAAGARQHGHVARARRRALPLPARAAERQERQRPEPLPVAVRPRDIRQGACVIVIGCVHQHTQHLT